jgi:eukaryotic-like serine/threonine-protein kinase
MLERGQTVGRYVVGAPLGRGGMGSVYRATDTVLQREVALKVLDPEGVQTIGPDARARFAREARAAASLQHPNIVSVHDVGEHGGLPYLAMELVVGTTMRHLIGDASISIPMRIRWLVEVAGALIHAHERGLVHRDVKPENVLISSEGVAKLADFGIVKQRDTQLAPQSFRTRTGQLVGTPDYMAPEQWASADVDARADQYAWGLVAYELLAEQLPLGRPPPIQSAAAFLPDAVAGCITRAIEHRANDRWPSMLEIVRVLEPYAAPQVTESALMRSVPSALSSGETSTIALALGRAATVKMAPHHATAPMDTPELRAQREEATYRRRRPVSNHRAPRERTRPREWSPRRTFVLAVVITIAVAVAVLAIAFLLTR